MTTYNTYQEAKIGNPNEDIYATKVSMGGRVEVFGVYVIIGNITSNYHICDPSKYCMTVEKFLADGYRFVKGDIYLNSNGRTLGVVNIPDYNNERSTIDCDLYILRAAALENIPTETPEEKEALDGIESAGEVEWKNGDECLYKDFKYTFIGMTPTFNDFSCLIFDCSQGIKHIDVRELSKPETPQQREERERLEAAYDLYCYVTREALERCRTASFSEFNKGMMTSCREEYLVIVDKTNYRKEKTHGTN
ncbi:hypothetical protein VPH95E331_0086 [Vibrio phage 95E33-1]|nr:hypothetical protein MYOV022v2_p0071 [Vibrio phage 12E28.1]QZI90240.1 hypothetical protein MYOV021v2_p0071 [Vibrio phage 18E29.1]QZI90606.1 hypothetical protein MYOV023v1_p0059 [Vibrio phage 91E28.1a]QZI90645.1 hypothetical protein MYOV020v1_p0019 [Vibrio phage 98E28.6a]